MDASHRARRRRGGGQRLPNLALIASLFLHPSHIAPAAGATAPSHLYPRIAGEHVVLADCLDGTFVSSQVAYYPGDAVGDPQDVAVVSTPSGQAALWVNAVTHVLFTDTSVNFTATLGPRVAEGQFAGSGYNDYGNFSCYQIYFKDRYTYGTAKCAQVYLCDHSAAPPGSATTGSSSQSMSQGTIIGIAVGVVGGVLFLAAAGLVYWYLRRSRRREAERNQLLQSGTISTGTGPGSDATAVEIPTEPPTEPPSRAVMQQMSAVYEVDGRLFRIEMANDNGRFEMDASGHGRLELDSSKGGPEPEIKDALSPALPDSPAVGYVPKSPPPEYSQYSR